MLNGNRLSQEFDKNTVLTLVVLVRNIGVNDNFLFSQFLMPQKDESFLRHHRDTREKIMSFFISIILGCVGQEMLDKVFSPRFS